MASVSPKANFMIEVLFEKREDGGLRARCDKVPNFYLSHSDPELVRADVEPALATILSDMFGLPVSVERLPDIDEALRDQPSFPAHLCNHGRYLGQTEAH